MRPIDLRNTPFSPLASHLLDILHSLEGQDIPLILVGGFGLYLRRRLVETEGLRTLYDILPEPRATEDFDLAVRLHLLADIEKMQTLRNTLNRLGYEVVKSAEEYQFYKPGTGGPDRRNVKVDLMAREPGPDDPRLHSGGVRLMPRRKNNPLHAFRTPEAIAVEDGVREIVIAGSLTTGEVYQCRIFIPHPYALYLMKLFAFRDEEIGRKGIPRPLYARKHALDLYTLTALLTPDEYDTLTAYHKRYGTHPIGVEAAEIVRQFFGSQNASGALRLLEHTNFPEANRLEDFLALLQEVFNRLPA